MSNQFPTVINDQDNLKTLVSDILAEATRQGASSAEAGIASSAGLSVSARLGEVETIEHVRDRGIGITIYLGKRKGSASTTDFNRKAIKETIQAACAIARYTSEDNYAGLADPARMATDMPDLDLYHPWELEPETAITIAVESENVAREFDTRITNSEGTTVNWHEGIHVYGNSHGFLGVHSGTRHSTDCTVIAGSGAKMQRDGWYTSARDPIDLEDAKSIGTKAAKRAIARLDARKIPTQTVPIVFQSEIATGLFGHFLSAISGGMLYRKSSFLLDHLGKRVFPEFVRIHEQPHLPKAPGSTTFDNEGVATKPRNVVTDGVLQGYMLGSYSARKLGMETTGNAGGAHNLTVEPNAGNLAEILDEMGTGLLVTELMGSGVNIVTGDYSRGASGFWVEGGKIGFPVQEITIAGNLRDIFLGIRQIGSDVEKRGNIRTGSVLIEQMTVAGS
uniref:PmbA protein n=1 Tax=Candidatus Kentrum sp. UNK TaxID=2126344 RepID=A0A450ZVR4_9GAMM|nr:MAG: microcin-processing peptidase 1. Unknown type peptidase. MEROPS family U62 [Candidatus Kentron sp. UNK]VFK69693.1 MAG: microcin-processing peptidase 1. Unknown type peptidase. MEROPS family U62 [Candidatus Kentron sp. UNK]